MSKKTLIAICSAVGAIMLTYWLWPQDAEEAHAPPDSASAGRHPGLRSPQSENPLGSLTTIPRAVSTYAVAAGGNSQTSYDLCGLGWISGTSISVEPDSSISEGSSSPLSFLPTHVGMVALDDARRQLTSILNDGDVRQRGAAWLLNKPSESNPQELANWARSFFDDAMKSRDPQVMRWAGQACMYVENGPACRHALVRERVQLEPANAAHWADLAQEDPEASQAAWEGLKKATYWREAPMSISGAVQRAKAPGIAGYLRDAVLNEMSQQEGNLGSTSTELMEQRCLQGDAANKAACDRLTNLMLDSSDSTVTVWQGRKMAQKLGFSAERLEQVDLELQQINEQDLRWKIDQNQSLNCATVEARAQFAEAVEKEGELVVLRKRFAALNLPH